MAEGWCTMHRYMRCRFKHQSQFCGHGERFSCSGTSVNVMAVSNRPHKPTFIKKGRKQRNRRLVVKSWNVGNIRTHVLPCFLAVVYTLRQDFWYAAHVCATWLQQYFIACYINTAVFYTLLHYCSSTLYSAILIQQYFILCYITTAVLYTLLHYYSSILYSATWLQQYIPLCYKNYRSQSIRSVSQLNKYVYPLFR
jgi:hypothetical protein